MPGHARKDIVREGEIGTYHCWSRCVQRAFLCGYDPVTQRDFDYRRGWIEDLLAYQARVFAIDVGNFNVLSNHHHSLCRTRPDLAARWPAEEVALRWKLADEKVVCLASLAVCQGGRLQPSAGCANRITSKDTDTELPPGRRQVACARVSRVR